MKETTLSKIIDDKTFNLLQSLKATLPEKNTTWSKGARKIQFRMNRKKYK